VRDLTVGQNAETPLLLTPAAELVVEGALRYQACEARACYPLQTVPLEWTFRMPGHNGYRAPVGLQKAERRARPQR